MKNINQTFDKKTFFNLSRELNYLKELLIQNTPKKEREQTLEAIRNLKIKKLK